MCIYVVMLEANLSNVYRELRMFGAINSQLLRIIFYLAKLRVE